MPPMLPDTAYAEGADGIVRAAADAESLARHHDEPV